MENKTCSQCKRNLPNIFEFFGIDKKRKDGYSVYCRQCRSKIAKSHYEKNRDRITKQQRQAARNQPKHLFRKDWKNKVTEELKINGHFNNHLIAERTGTTYNFVISIREYLENNGTIPYAEKMLCRDGRWRKRLLRSDKNKKSPFGRQDLIYFIQVVLPTGDADLIKIGYTNRLHERMGTYKLHNPYTLNLLAIMPGNREMETEIQDRFCNFNVTGEWYKPEKELLEYIENIKVSYPPESLMVWTIHNEKIKKIISNPQEKYIVQKPAKPNPYAELGKKQCLRCKTILLLDKFYKNTQQYDGKTQWCKKCILSAVTTRNKTKKQQKII